MVELTGKLKDSPWTSQTFYFVNRAWLDTTNWGTYRPVLREIRGLGLSMGDFLPAPINGQIEIDNSPESWGYEQKFSDNFDRYTFVDQAITVYHGQTTVTGVAPSFGGAWTGKVSRYRCNFEDNACVFEVQSLPISQRVMTRIVDSATFSSAPTRSLGQHIPMVLGDGAEVKPILISAEGSTAPDFALATTLGTQFVTAGVNYYTARDINNQYQTLASAANVGTAVLSESALTTSADTLSSEEVAFDITDYTQGTDNYVLTQVSFLAIRQGGVATVDKQVIVRIYSVNQSNNSPSEVLGTAVIDQSDYQASFDAGTEFTMSGSFDRPVVLGGSQKYAISFQSADATTQGYKFSSTVVTTWVKGPDWYIEPAFVATLKYGLYGVKFTPTLTGSGVSSEGLGYTYVSLSQNTAGTGQTNPDLSKLDLIVSVQGLKDDTSGTISGSASATLHGPRYLLPLLTQTWNGSSWVTGPISTSKFSDSWVNQDSTAGARYKIHIQGRTSGRTTLEQLLTDICRNSAMRIGAIRTSSSTNLSMYGWGTTRSSVASLTDEEARIISYEQIGVESIVNRLTLNYAQLLRFTDAQRVSQDGTIFQNSAVVNWYNGLNALVTGYTEGSETLYGKRLMRDIEHKLVYTSESAEHVAESILARYAKPLVFVTLEVPFAEYSTLDLLDVIDITHPDLPLFGGTSYDAKQPYSTSGDACDLIGKHYWRRAKKYRAQIEASQINWNARSYPTLTLRVVLLLNYPKDPT